MHASKSVKVLCVSQVLCLTSCALKALGFSPKAVLDLEASSGHWGALMKERFSASPFLVSFSSTARGNTSLATGFPTIVVDAASVK